MLTLDIIEERIGAFHVGQILSLPDGTRTSEGMIVKEGDAITFDPYKDVSLWMIARHGSDGMTAQILEAIIDDTSSAYVLEQPMTRLSLNELLKYLSERSIAKVADEDSVIWLSAHASLGVFGDRIDKIWIGDVRRLHDRQWKTDLDWKEVNLTAEEVMPK